MNIVIGREVAEQLGEKYTVLPLETFTRDGVFVEAYCVIPAEKINLGEMMFLEENVRLHNGFLEAYKEENWERMREIDEHLRGKFGGEVDTFYEELLSREPK